MKKFYQIGIAALITCCISTTIFSASIQRAAAAVVPVSTDTLFYVDFKNLPAAFTTGDIYTASTSNANKEKTVNGITFGAGPNGQRINMNTSQSASPFGSSATTYVSATADDDGATAGAFSFIKAGATSGAGGYIILPEVEGPCDITIWSCSANTGNTQSYKMWSTTDNGANWTALGTTAMTDYKLIHKNTFAYTGNDKVKIKLVCTTGSNANCNLYIYDVLMTKRPSLTLSSAIGSDNQTVTTALNESIVDIVYTWGSIANNAIITWSGTASTATPPTGISVNSDPVSKTITITGTPTELGTYSYSIVGTNGTLSTPAHTGTIKVVNTPVPLITLTSLAATKSQKVTAGTAISNVEYTWGGSAFNAHLTWTGTTSSTTSPDGIIVAKDSLNEKITISGTPTVAGNYGWSISANDSTLTSVALNGTLTVVPPPTIGYTSDISTSNQTVAFCKPISNIVLTYGGSTTSTIITWSGTPSSTASPAGITVSTDATAKTITIAGMPYLTGTYNFTITATDGTITSSPLTGKIVSSATTETLISFPGAVGYGSHATGGRKGSVYHVTNLDDSGPGSFRDAVSTSNRIIVFDVSGYIILKTAVSCKSNLTIAGQTAPGEGIGFRGGEISFANQQNIICRHVRIVTGSETVSTGDDALSLYLARNAILDHCTFEFAPWNNIDGVSDNYAVYPVTGITLQNCINANPTGQQFGAHCESVISQWTFYRNLFANSHNRNPLAKINDQFINNVHYNNEAGYTTHTSSTFKHDIVNNYFVWGPASGSNVPWFQMDANQSIYYPGNLCDTNLDGQLNGTTTTPVWYAGAGTTLTAPWSPLTTSIPTVDAPSAYRTVISTVGTLPLSQLDSLIINQTKTLGAGTSGYGVGTTGPIGGLYASQIQTGLIENGYGIIRGGAKDIDTDNDGMPDYWEQATGSNVNSDDAMQIDANGYSLIENYINWKADLHERITVNTPINIDLGKYTGGFSSVNPTYSCTNSVNGNATLQADGRTVRFVPTTDFSGIGSFNFTVTGSDNTTYTDSIKIVVSGVGPNAIELVRNNISIYPNPATDYIILNNTNSGWYEIYDITGKLVLKGELEVSLSQQKIDVTRLMNGLFTLKIFNNEYSSTHKFVKRK